MTISSILAAKGTEVATIASDAPMSEAVAELGGRRIGALLVIDAGEVKGIVSERDVIYCLREHGSQILDWPVSRAMTAPAIVVAPDTAVLSAMAVVFGLGIGVATTAIYATATNAVPAADRGVAFGYLTTAYLVGLAISPVLAGFIGSLSMRAVFLADAVGLGVIAWEVRRRMTGSTNAAATG